MRTNGAENCHDANLVRDGGAAAAPPLANAGAARRGSLAGDGERLPLPALHPTLRPHAAAAIVRTITSAKDASRDLGSGTGNPSHITRIQSFQVLNLPQ